MAKQRKFSNTDIQEMIELHSKYKFSCELIGSIFNCKKHIVWNRLKKAGVRIDNRVVTKEIFGVNHSTCATCKVLKPFDMFRNRKLNMNGIDSNCKECVREYERLARLDKVERYRERNRVWRVSNPDKTKMIAERTRSKEGYKERQAMRKKEWTEKNYGYVQHTNKLREAAKIQALPAWADKEKLQRYIKKQQN